MAQQKKDEKEKLAPIVIKRIKKGGGGHHGGAWKVAYADFVTAMMAFFLLLWLLNVTTENQKNAISNYFDPSHPKVSDFTSGAGGVMGGLSIATEGAMVSNVQPLTQAEVNKSTTRGEMSGNKNIEGEEDVDAAAAAELKKQEDQRFQQAAEQLKAEIAKSADLKDLQKNLMIDITPEGLRIQIVDDQGRSMFPSGSAVMYDFMRQLLQKVTGVVVPLPNQISVRGHTDSAKYRDPGNYDNWNLSADRAQASRRVMVQAGLPEKRIENVMGRSDRELLDANAASPRNRRISIILMREAPSKAALDKAKKDIATQAAKDAAAKAGGVQIVDDTPAPKPAAAGEAAKADEPQAPAPAPDAQTDSTADTQATPQTGTTPANTAAPDTLLQQNIVPLPTTPDEPGAIKRQPQVMVFGDDGAAQPEAEGLYEGPTQSPYVTTPENNGPPRITTPVFKLPSESGTTATPQPATPPATPTTPSQKTLTFGDPIEAPAPPTQRAILPSSDGDMQLINPDDAQQSPADGAPQAPVTDPVAGTIVVPQSAPPGGNKELTF